MLTARDTLNHLIATNSDARNGFQTAATLAGDPAIKALLLEIGAERARFGVELVPHAERLGGPAAADGSRLAGWHRRWMDMRSRLQPHDDRAIVAEAERGDAVSLRAYADAVNSILPPAIREVVERQHASVIKSHEQLAEILAHAAS